MKHAKTNRRAFTLIELLVVIAIIAILAAIIFPVFGRVREAARQTSCQSQLHDVSVALKLYREDNAKFPAALYGFVQNTDNTFYTTGPAAQIDAITYKPLFRGGKYLKDKGLFLCPDSQDKDITKIRPAVYPLRTPLADQPYAFTGLIQHNMLRDVPNAPIYFYASDSYDAGPRLDANGSAVMQGGVPLIETHYSLDWTGALGGNDPSNQLKYTNADPNHTIVTLCPYHSATASSGKVILLMLSGRTKVVSAGEWVGKGPLGF